MKHGFGDRRPQGRHSERFVGLNEAALSAIFLCSATTLRNAHQR